MSLRTSISVALAFVAGGIFLIACSGSSLGPGAAAVAPAPASAPADNAEVTYVRQRGQWFQFRMELDESAVRHDAEYNLYDLNFKAKASVWKFNRETGEYDLPPMPGLPGSRASHGLTFSFDSGDEIKLRMAQNGGGSSGGSVGWPKENMTRARIDVEPSTLGSAVPMEDGSTFEVVATATMEPTAREREGGKEPVVVIAKQKWKVNILAPEKRAKFTRVE